MPTLKYYSLCIINGYKKSSTCDCTVRVLITYVYTQLEAHIFLMQSEFYLNEFTVFFCFIGSKYFTSTMGKEQALCRVSGPLPREWVCITVSSDAGDT